MCEFMLVCVCVCVRARARAGACTYIPEKYQHTHTHTHTQVVGGFQKAWAVGAAPGSMWRQHQGTAAVITRAVYETRAVSQAAMGPAEGTYYYAGGFYGGRVTEVSVCVFVFAGVSCRGEVGVGGAGGRAGSGVESGGGGEKDCVSWCRD